MHIPPLAHDHNKLSSAVINIVSEEEEQYCEMWIPHLNLALQDQKILHSSTSWLTDAIVNAAQELLKKENTAISGLQNVILGQVNAFNVEQGEFVQILHTGHSHWNVVSTIDRKHPEVDIFDSLYSSCSNHSKVQIANIISTKHPTIKLRYVDVKKQSGHCDCGIFAIAFATAIVYGRNPGQYIFKQSAMRDHLLQCIKNGKVTMFPIQKNRRTSYKVKRI